MTKHRQFILKKKNIISNPFGDIYKVLDTSDDHFSGFGEVYVSEIFKNSVKAWKKHLRLETNLVVICGVVRFVLHDTNSGTFEQFDLGPSQEYQSIIIYPQLVYGFKGIENKNFIVAVLPEQHSDDESKTFSNQEILFNWG